MADEEEVEHPDLSKPWKIKRDPAGRTHIENCKTGYKYEAWFTQVHHILCMTCLQDKTIERLYDDPAEVLHIRRCLAVTTWDINGERNVIGLPLKSAIVYKDPSEWDGFPCHLVDHNPHYTERLIEEVETQVFNAALEQIPTEKCKIKPRSVRNQLIAVANKRRAFLIARGSGAHSGGSGTAECWKRRNTDLKNIWYIPFSMHPDTPPRRKPVPDWNALKKKMKVKDALNKVFALI